MVFWTYTVLVHHRKWRIGEYLGTYTLFVTLLPDFLVEIAAGLGPLDCDCSASEDDTALDGIEETAPSESCATPKISWIYVSCCLRINVCCLVQKMEVVGEEISFC